MRHAARPTLGYALFPTALGSCAIAWGDQAITACTLPAADEAATAGAMQALAALPAPSVPPAWVAAVASAVADLLRGDSTAHDRLLPVPLDMARASPLQAAVWEATRRIPPGQTLEYGELATLLGRAGGARAVGQALGANPFAPIVPCHRVLARGHAGGGFSATGGLATKLWLLQTERARFGGPGLFDAH